MSIEDRVGKVENRLDRFEKKMRKHTSERDERQIQCANRLERIEKKLQKRAKEKKMTLTDKFAMHDHAQSLVRWFEEMENELHSTLKPEHYKDLKEIIKNFSNLVDNALGAIP
ncbi:hypothetical protein ES703_47242 [subsurface metagenome]